MQYTPRAHAHFKQRFHIDMKIFQPLNSCQRPRWNCFKANERVGNYANVTCWESMATYRCMIVNLFSPFPKRIVLSAQITLFHCKTISHWNILFHNENTTLGALARPLWATGPGTGHSGRWTGNIISSDDQSSILAPEAMTFQRRSYLSMHDNDCQLISQWKSTYFTWTTRTCRVFTGTTDAWTDL